MINTQRIVSAVEVRERLGALDWEHPIVRTTEVEQHMLRFLRHLALVRPEADPNFYWFNGVNNFRNRLLDNGIFPHNPNMNSNILNRVRNINSELHHPNLQVSHASAMHLIEPQWGHFWQLQPLLCDIDFLQAVEAGLGYFMVQSRGQQRGGGTPEVVVLVARPELRVRREIIPGQITAPQDVLHSLRGAAARFPLDESSSQYWIRGVRVPQFVVETPERITRAHIRAARSAELRRTLIDQYGLLRYSVERGFKVIDRNDQFGAILYARGGNRTRYGGVSERQCVIELINSTPEPDGTNRHFARRVPGRMQSAHEAVAWTFGFDNPADYHPAVQT